MNHKRVVNSKHDTYDEYIGRPSKWGNPFSHLKSEIAEFKVNSRSEAIQQYAYWIQQPEQEQLRADIVELVGKTLGCFCEPSICHGTILAELADRTQEDFARTVKEFTSEGDNLTQEIYQYLFNIKDHIELTGSTEFIRTTKQITSHLNNNRSNFIIILIEEISETNTIQTRTH